MVKIKIFETAMDGLDVAAARAGIIV